MSIIAPISTLVKALPVANPRFFESSIVTVLNAPGYPANDTGTAWSMPIPDGYKQLDTIANLSELEVQANDHSYVYIDLGYAYIEVLQPV